MSILERRLQVLIDAERYASLEQESRSTGRSVGSIVRSALDAHFSQRLVVERRARAAERLLARTAEVSEREPDWAESKAAIEAAQSRSE